MYLLKMTYTLRDFRDKFSGERNRTRFFSRQGEKIEKAWQGTKHIGGVYLTIFMIYTNSYSRYLRAAIVIPVLNLGSTNVQLYLKVECTGCTAVLESRST